MEKRRRGGKGWIVYFSGAVLVVFLNAAAWNSTAFCDWYIAAVFPVWVGTYGRVTGIFPFSVGEVLLGAGLVLTAMAAVLGMLWACIGIWAVVRKLCFGKRPAAYRLCRFSKGYGSFFAWTFLIVCLIMTLNCFILYHASTFSQQYFGEDEGEYTFVELIEVYNLVAEKCNSLAQIIDRDADGMAVYRGSVKEGQGAGGKADTVWEESGQLLDMEDKARELMVQLGRSYPQLDGYYPRPKALWASDFMCQQHMQGYYFPFSMEANYNDVMHILNKPATMCHELAHLRGYIYEDEANFISYLACVQSEDPFFQYAGYLSVLVYLNNDLYKAWKEEPSAYEKAAAIVRPVAVDPQVWEDNLFVTEEEWERINRKAWIDTEVVDKAADVFIDTNLKVNGIADGKISYSRVVRLLLQYYRRYPLQAEN